MRGAFSSGRRGAERRRSATLRTVALSVALSVAPGCTRNRAATSPVVAPVAATPDAQSVAQSVAQAAPQPVRCPAGGDRFASYAFAGRNARAVAALDLTSTEFDGALANLTATARGERHGLPIEFAFAAGQWGWQVPLVRSTLAGAGFAPAELVYLVLEDGSPLWAWPSACDLLTATAAVHAAWGLTLRATTYGAAAPAPTGDDGAPAFAYDLLVWGAQFYAFVPAGRGYGVAQRLGAVGSDNAEARLGTELAQIEPAPIRVALPRRGLLDPTHPADTAPASRLRVLPARIERSSP